MADRQSSPSPGVWRRRVTAVAVFTVVAALSVAGALLHERIPIQEWALRLEALMRPLGPLAAVFSIALMVLHSLVPFPAELLALANAVVFGPLWGAVITWCGAMAGAVLAFAVARWIGRRRILGRTSAQYQRMERWLVRWGVPALLVLRLLPIVSFNLVNVGAGLAPVRWRTFLWTTAVGVIPMIVLMSTLGGAIISGTTGTWLWLLAPLVVALWLLGRWVGARLERRGNRARHPNTDSRG